MKLTHILPILLSVVLAGFSGYSYAEIQDFVMGEIVFIQADLPVTGIKKAIIQLHDADLNTDPTIQEQVIINAWSDSNKGGTEFTVTEINADSHVFEGIFWLDSNEGSTGLLSRKHVTINKSSIRYIGKESNELEESEVLGVSEKDYSEYVDRQGKLLEIIRNLTLDVALRIGLPRRTFFDLKEKASSSQIINLKGKTLRKLRQLQFEDKQEVICKV